MGIGGMEECVCWLMNFEKVVADDTTKTPKIDRTFDLIGAPIVLFEARNLSYRLFES